MADRSQDLALEKTQADGTLCAHVHTHTPPGGPSILMWSGPAEWITPTFISRDSQWPALSICVCACINYVHVCSCASGSVWLLNICPVSQQRISRFDLSISLNRLRQQVSTLRLTEMGGEAQCHSVWHKHTHTHTFATHSSIKVSQEKTKQNKKIKTKYENLKISCLSGLHSFVIVLLSVKSQLIKILR